MNHIRPSQFFLLFSFIFTYASGQPAPNSIAKISGEAAQIRSTVMSSNNVTFIMYNYGQFTRPALIPPNKLDLVWRKLGYLFEFGPILAAEVISDSGDTLHVLDDGMWLVSQGGYAPDGSIKWGWLPRNEYVNPSTSRLATRNDTLSWPPDWPAWYGREGFGSGRGLNEALYVMDDFTNAEFEYYPFPADSSKRGLGVSVEVRVYQHGGGLRDAVIIEWNLRNESAKDIPQAHVGFYCDPHIGGTNDFADDLCGYLPALNTAYAYDADGTGNDGLATGHMGFRFLETPGDNGLTNLKAIGYGPSNFPKNRPLFWDLLSADTIDAEQEFFASPGDYVLTFGTGPFALNAGDSTRVVMAILFSEDLDDLTTDAGYVDLAYHWPDIDGEAATFGGDSSVAVQIIAPDSGRMSGTVPVTWQYAGSDPNAKILVEASFDGGFSWHPVQWDVDPAQQAFWNTTETRDGVNHLVRVVAYSQDRTRFFWDVSDHRLTIDNPGNAQPELVLDREFEGKLFRYAPLEVSWIAEDADDTSLTISLETGFSPNGPFSLVHSGEYPAGQGSYVWDYSQVSNAESCYVKVTASDGSAELSLVSHGFSLYQRKGSYVSDVFEHVAGYATPDLELLVIDSSSVTGHEYELTFTTPSPDTTLMTIADLEAGAPVVNQWYLQAGVSTPPFDGLKLQIHNPPTDIDTSRSGFSRADLDTAVDFHFTTAFSANPRESVRAEWFFVFNSLDTLADGSWASPGDTLLNQFGAKVVITPFRILTGDPPHPFRGIVTEPSSTNNRWDLDQSVLIISPSNPLRRYYNVNFHFPPGILPNAGDTLFVRTSGALTETDIFRFVADGSFITAAESREAILSFSLSNNYPNPFNPSTTIQYSIPYSGRTSVVVYDLLGRIVRTLVDGYREAGQHRVVMDASDLPTGVYFYRLQGSGFAETRKMLIVK